MPEMDSKIPELEKRLDDLVRTQIDFQKEISSIRGELTRLRGKAGSERSARSFYVPPEPPPKEPNPAPPPRTSSSESVPPPSFGYAYNRAESESSREPDPVTKFIDSYIETAKADFEKFIGENLISKIGIVVLVLGVGIGAKYAIDNNLISPLTRIVIGYVFGFGLVGLAIKLKPKYHNFSAVLMSGGMAIMYFVTYFAYSSYGLIPQLSAFALMVMFTIFTVAAALAYNRQVIAHIGLVGAYAVPFLLSSDSGNYLALFVYMAIVNSGILAISVKKLWNPIFYTSFAFTWLIYYGWFMTKFASAEHFYLALAFATIFFAIFYAAKIAQKIFHDETDNKENLVSSLINGFVLYVACIAVSDAIGETNRVWIFFTYLALISVVILVSSFRFYRQAFVYLCFPFVWAIYGAWYADRYDANEHFAVAAVFAGVFFAIFYLTVLVHRLVSESFTFIEHTTAVLANSFIFYGFGYSIIDGSEALRNYLGLYTAANSALHLAVAHVVSRFKESAVDVVQVLTILVLTFASIAVPVQFDGNFVTLIWTMESALLFWLGRTKAIRLFERFSYPVMVLAIGSMFLDWAVAYGDRTDYVSEFNRIPLVNGDLVTAIVFVAAFAFIFFTNRDEDLEPAIDKDLVRPFGWAVATVGVFVLYNAFRIEIGNYHHTQAVALRESTGDPANFAIRDLSFLNIAWQLSYTLFSLTGMAAINIVKLRSRSIAVVNSLLAGLALFGFVTVGMVLFSDLRESFMSSEGAGYINVAIRYVSYFLAGLMLYALHRYAEDSLLDDLVPIEVRRIGFEAVVYTTIFIAVSCELVNLMGQLRIPDATKLGLSILWGVYALVMIVIGIARNKKHLRFAAFGLIAVTLAKLFLYDIADLDTIPKTILFVTLGITLLVISFLYNKYKDVLFASTVPEGE